MKIEHSTYWINVKFLNNLFIKILLYNRLKINKRILKNIKCSINYKVLDVGTNPSLENHENVFVHNYPWKKNLTCISNLNCEIINGLYPEVNVLKGDGRKLQFKDNTYDLVYSNAVIEHVGNFKNQTDFISECLRVSKNKICINTPNRFFPFDVHTKIPFFHMLPKKTHRWFLKLLGLHYFSLEENLNLMSKNDLKLICKNLKIEKYKIINIFFLGFVSNFILIISK